MKLAEALIERADLQKRVEQLKQRMLNYAKVQEGETPPEDPKELGKELLLDVNRLNTLVKQISRTNHETNYDEKWTLGDALIERDMIGKKREIYSDLAAEASLKQDRYSRTEIKYITPFNVRDLQKKVDELSKRYREVDTRIQELNWRTDLKDQA
ncbi:DIP1984 family protein [Alteribacter natronophilus]|uniref:DIP1984 family protein n=1 Tax=Alteribacter natronophilus TaxID=2583810 RepID=UPI00110D288D|nr:DIP1984 family protein [Alteribacter natronophilus]TMW71405.1 hypothetical protein FGB90_10155 [Alteribacter natronophilus]